MPPRSSAIERQHPERVNGGKETQRGRQRDADETGRKDISSAPPSDRDTQPRRVREPSDHCEQEENYCAYHKQLRGFHLAISETSLCQMEW